MILTPRWLRVCCLHIWLELLKLARMPVYVVLLTLLPAVFYSLSAGNPRVPDIEGVPGRTYLIATMAVFSATAIALFGFGVGYATERGQGWMQSLRPTPASPVLTLLAKMVACALVTLIALIGLMLLGRFLFDVRLAPMQVVLLISAILVCSIPLSLIGLTLGAMVGANSAPIIMMLLFLPIASISGIVVPMEMIQRGNPILVQIAPMWPTYHAGQFVLGVVRPAPAGSVWIHAMALICYTALFAVAAVLVYRRGEGRMHG